MLTERTNRTWFSRLLQHPARNTEKYDIDEPMG